MVTRPVMASRASAIRLNWRIVVIVISGCRQSKSAIMSGIGFCRSSVAGVCKIPNGTTKASFVPPQFWRRYCQTPIITDLTTVTGNTSNSYHVVTGATGATLDGFTITAGNGNDPSSSNSSGGGMYNDTSSPVLTNLTFSGNSADYGGGMYNHNSDPTLTNVTFGGNSAIAEGGGMNNYAGSDPTLTNVTFSGNTAPL